MIVKIVNRRIGEREARNVLMFRSFRLDSEFKLGSVVGNQSDPYVADVRLVIIPRVSLLFLFCPSFIIFHC